MRFIIRELPYERLLMAGQLSYERDGKPTGAVESWRLTDAAGGYRFLRVDLDARAAPSGRSTLYHLTLAPSGQAEQLKYRFWGDGLEIAGSLVREGDEWFGRRTVNNEVHEDVAAGESFWFPSGMGLTLLRGRPGRRPAVTLGTATTEPEQAMRAVETVVSTSVGEVESIRYGDAVLICRPMTVKWNGTRRIVWLDDDGRPIRLWRDDELTARAERLLR
ncbi:MAG TPA: hypothetical protein VF434_10285 [Promineifilum sp.]